MTTVLFTQKKSIYTQLETDTWDIKRDATKWKGRQPVIAHPPCRAWGNLSHFAKPLPAEWRLTIWTVAIIRRYGGVMEHPVTSRIWKSLPKPGQTDAWGGFTINIDQHWFGHRAKKNTTLYIVGTTPKNIPPIPLRFEIIRKTVESMGKKEREHTPVELAKWLIKLIEIIKKNKTEQTG